MLEAYDKIAAGYRRRVWDIVDKFIEGPVEVIADLGCGPAHNSVNHLVKGRAAKAVALDLSMIMLERGAALARKNSVDHRLFAVAGDMRKLPLRDSSVDSVLIISSLHHILPRDGRLTALNEVKRVLKHGGKALTIVWARWQAKLLPHLFRGVMKFLLRKSRSPWDMVICKRTVCREYHMYSLGELVRDVREAGLLVERSGTYVAPGREGLPRKNYFVVAVKPSL